MHTQKKAKDERKEKTMHGIRYATKSEKRRPGSCCMFFFLMARPTSIPLTFRDLHGTLYSFSPLGSGAKEGERVTHPLHPLRSRAPRAKQCPLPGYYLRTFGGMLTSILSSQRCDMQCIASVVSFGEDTLTMPLICERIKTQVHTIISYGFPIVCSPRHVAQAQQPHHPLYQTLPLRIRHHLSCFPLHQLPPSGCRRYMVQECAQLLPSPSQAPRQPCCSTLRRGVGGV